MFCRYSGILFMVAAIILACAEHISMIIIGRVFQGVAVSTLLALKVHLELSFYLVGCTGKL